jgi:hypothetical protein
MFCYLLNHVQDSFVFVQPNIVIRNGHGLESHGLCILEE